jgi:hypothetical protein
VVEVLNPGKPPPHVWCSFAAVPGKRVETEYDEKFGVSVGGVGTMMSALIMIRVQTSTGRERYLGKDIIS